jgi:DNA-directed RNA polymerase subunit F
MKVKDEEYVYPVEALEALEDRDEENLAHEQKIALENLTRHTKIKDLDTLQELNEELSDIDSLKQKHVYKLLEVVPQHESTVRAVFSKERVKLEDSEVEEILDICQSIETE